MSVNDIKLWFKWFSSNILQRLWSNLISEVYNVLSPTKSKRENSSIHHITITIACLVASGCSGCHTLLTLLSSSSFCLAQLLLSCSLFVLCSEAKGCCGAVAVIASHTFWFCVCVHSNHLPSPQAFEVSLVGASESLTVNILDFWFSFWNTARGLIGKILPVRLKKWRSLISSSFPDNLFLDKFSFQPWINLKGCFAGQRVQAWKVALH